jgi:hypothetical protein
VIDFKRNVIKDTQPVKRCLTCATGNKMAKVYFLKLTIPSVDEDVEQLECLRTLGEN